MAKIYGALEVAQLEWFTDAGKPAPSSYIYRVIYVSDLKQIQVSDGSAWIPFFNTATDQAISGNTTFVGQQIFSGPHRLSVTTNSSTGAITALSPTTPVIEFTGAVTSIAGISSPLSGSTIMLVNRSGSSIQILDDSSTATASERIRTGTGTNLTLVNNASVLLTYVGDSRWHIIGGSGGQASGDKNYFQIADANPTLVTNTTSPWSACTLTLSSGVPSGSPTLSATQMAISVASGSPIAQSVSPYNLRLAKSAANAQGQGFISAPMTFDAQDHARIIVGSFSYQPVSGTIDLSGSSSQSLEVWIYNVTLNRWIQPAGYRGMNQSSGVGTVNFTFQSEAGSSHQYRLAVITSQTTASAYSVDFCDFKLSPQNAFVNLIPNLKDWTIYTPTYNSGFNPRGESLFYWKRVGDKMEVKGSIILGGAASPPSIVPTLGTGDFSFSIPSGYSVDTTKLPLTLNEYDIPVLGTISFPAQQPVGFARLFDSSTSTAIGSAQVKCVNSTTFSIFINSAGNNVVTQTAPWTWATTDQIYVEFSVPISGWGTTTAQISTDSDTRVVAFRATKTSAQSFPHAPASPYTAVQFDSIKNDSHGAWDAVNYRYVVQVSGYYDISARFLLQFGAATAEIVTYLVVDGVPVALQQDFKAGTASGNQGIFAKFLWNLNAGQTVQIRVYQANSSAAAINGVFELGGVEHGAMYVNRLSGPSIVGAAESVACRYNLTSFASPVNNSFISPPFNQRVFDTHNMASGVGTTSFQVTIPSPGLYHVCFGAGISATKSGVSESYTLFASGSVSGTFARSSLPPGSATASSSSGTLSSLIRLNQGEILYFTFASYRTDATVSSYDTSATFASIVRVGL